MSAPVNLRAILETLGYSGLRVVRGKVCGIRKFPLTTIIAVGLDARGYERRYILENEHDARTALAAWGIQEHPPGPWLRLEGMMKGCYVDFANPEFGRPVFGRVGA